MIGDSITTSLYQKALDGTWQRQKAISNNIANAETPGYKALKVSFEDTLKSEVQKIQANSTAGGAKNLASMNDSDIRVDTMNTTSNRQDGNNVNLDAENVEMSKTGMQYYYLVRGLTDTYSRLKYAISEGKR